MNDVDVRANLHRDQFEEWAKSILDRVLNPMKAALADSGARGAGGGCSFPRGSAAATAGRRSLWRRLSRRSPRAGRATQIP